MRRLSRRAFLRGTALGGTVALALPTLEATLESQARAEGLQADPIFGVFFWGNGLPWHDKHGSAQAGHPDLWTPKQTGAGFTPTELLAPLAGHPFSVITGLEPKTEIPKIPDGQADGHMRGFMVAMTSDRPRSEGFHHGTHTLTTRRPTLDQYVARHPEFYGTTPARYRSLALGASTSRFHNYGHWNAISFNGPDDPNQPISDPGTLFDLLFAAPQDTSALSRRAKLLDAVMGDAKDLQRRLGHDDRQRVSAHLENLSEIQRRLELGVQACDAPARPTNPTDLVERTGLMGRLLGLALACGLTRTFSFMMTSPATTEIFSNLGVSGDMHTICHGGQWDNVRKITLYHMQGFARLLHELHQVKDPAGTTVLDRCAILGTSEYGEGYKHGVREMPVLVAGKAAGKLKPGQHLRKERGNLSEAHLTVLRSIGLSDPSVGSSGGETSQVFSELLT